MAKQLVFVAHDLKADMTMTPFFALHEGQALRSWEEACNDANAPMCKWPSDFRLLKIGIYDDSTGALEGHAPVQVALATDYKKRDEKNQTAMKLQ